MSDIKKTLENYPEISFIEDMTLDQLRNEMVSDYCKEYFAITGKETELGLADRDRLIIYAASLQIYQGMQYVDNAGKRNVVSGIVDGF